MKDHLSFLKKNSPIEDLFWQLDHLGLFGIKQQEVQKKKKKKQQENSEIGIPVLLSW